MTSYGLTITDKCVATPAVCELRWGKCFGCNGDGTRTVPLDRDATPLADAVKALRAARTGAAIYAAESFVLDAALALFPKEDER